MRKVTFLKINLIFCVPKVIFIFNIKSTVGAVWKNTDYWMCQQGHSQEFLRAGAVSTELNLRWCAHFRPEMLLKERCFQSEINDLEMVGFIFYFWLEITFSKNWQKIKIVNLTWSLVSRLIWIYRIQSWCLFIFSVFKQKRPFCASLVPKFKLA